MIALIVAIVALVAILVVWFAIYNGLVKRRNLTRESFAQIDTQLQRRSDLIPNLVNTVKGYADHESKVFKDIAELRSFTDKARATKDVDDAARAEQAFGKAMAEIRATAEAYPDLKASENFQKLQEELTSTENKVSFARQHYNTTVNRYNTQIQTVPYNIIASLHGFTPEKMFQAEQSAKQAPTVEF